MNGERRWEQYTYSHIPQSEFRESFERLLGRMDASNVDEFMRHIRPIVAGAKLSDDEASEWIRRFEARRDELLRAAA